MNDLHDPNQIINLTAYSPHILINLFSSMHTDMPFISVSSTDFFEHARLPSRIQWSGVLRKWSTHILHAVIYKLNNLYLCSRCALMEEIALAKLALLVLPVEQCTRVQVMQGV